METLDELGQIFIIFSLISSTSLDEMSSCGGILIADYADYTGKMFGG